VLLSVFGALLAGCSTMPKIAPQASFLSDKGSIGIIWVAKTAQQKGEFYKEGSQMLGDLAISQGLADASDLMKRIRQEELKSEVKKRYTELFKSAFEAKGFTVKAVDECYIRGKLPEFNTPSGGKEGEFAEYDYTSIARELGVDKLSVLDVRAFGISRAFYGFVPTGSPRGYSQLSVALVEGKSNRLLGLYPLTAMTKNCEGDWNQPPEFAHLVKAMDKSMEDAVDEAFVLFFKQAP
jgi:hypothetical protein